MATSDDWWYDGNEIEDWTLFDYDEGFNESEKDFTAKRKNIAFKELNKKQTILALQKDEDINTGYYLNNYHVKLIGKFHHRFQDKKSGKPKYVSHCEIPHLVLPTKFPLNLNTGYKQFVDKYVFKYNTTILQWIYENNFNVDNIDFVGHRGVFRDIGNAAYDFPDSNREAWCVELCKFKNTVYMRGADANEYLIDVDEIENPTGDTEEIFESYKGQNHYSYWGKKFKNYMVNGGKVSNVIFDGCNYIVVASHVGRFKGILSAGMDCQSDDYATDNPLDRYIELKTNKIIEHVRQDIRFKQNKLRSI